MRISRLILSGAAIGTIIGTGRPDLSSTHVLNPAWPPHARFLRTRAISCTAADDSPLYRSRRSRRDGFASLDSPPLRQVAAPTAGTG
jgi:hypothetical protein